MCFSRRVFKNIKLATKAKLSKTSKENQTENWKQNNGCYSSASDREHSLKIKTENKTLDATPMQVIENTI